MGQRKYQRVKMVLPVRIAGKDANGETFSQLSHTLDFSRVGARLGGVRARLRAGDEITVEYKRNRGRFKVRWVAANRSQVGLESLDPGKSIFIELPEEKYLDDVDAWRLREEAARSTATPIVPAKVAALPAHSQTAETVNAAAEKPGPPAAVLPMTAVEQLANLKSKLRETKDDTDAALQLVADASRELLSASGAAVAVSAGDDWICRASSGVAPRIGVHFQSPQGLTGQAAVSGQAVICRDTEVDRRVNSSIWRSVQLRSAASVPIMRKTNVLGVLEVFAENPDAFSDEHGPLLRELGELLAGLITASSTSGE